MVKYLKILRKSENFGICPSTQIPPVMYDNFSGAEGVASDDRFYCT